MGGLGGALYVIHVSLASTMSSLTGAMLKKELEVVDTQSHNNVE